jgi:hypothetical protein
MQFYPAAPYCQGNRDLKAIFCRVIAAVRGEKIEVGSQKAKGVSQRRYLRLST